MIDPRSFGPALRATKVTYPVPYMVTILLLFSLLCFAGSLTVNDALRWLLAGTGVVAALSAGLGFGYALLFDPPLLRTEFYALRLPERGPGSTVHNHDCQARPL